jgi:hypothetical protein
MRLVVAELIATVCSLPNHRRKFGLLSLGPATLQEFPCGTSLPECSGASIWSWPNRTFASRLRTQVIDLAGGPVNLIVDAYINVIHPSMTYSTELSWAGVPVGSAR